MSNKIEEIRDIGADNFRPCKFAYVAGFDAAMELQLDIITKFMVWLPAHYNSNNFFSWIDYKTDSEVDGIEIYKYFLENIYKNEQDKI